MREGAIRVLLVEDDQDDYLLTRELFDQLPANEYTLDRAATFDAAVEAFHRCEHEIYLIDYRLGSRTGLELLAMGRAAGCTSPMIMLTGQQEREVDILSMQAGADDFLLKDRLDAPTLERSMRYALAQKRMEEEIRLSNLQLDERVRQRTAELNELNQALQAEIAERKRAEESLRDADRRKDVFLATLAHELRNPLAPLTNAIQLLAAEPDRGEQVRQLAGMMSQQLDQLVRLIDDLIDVSRIASGKLQLRADQVAVNDFIRAAVDQSRPLIQSAKHTLNVDLPEGEFMVQGDKIRLAQIIANLLINAAKYTPAGGRIDLSVRREGNDIAITVRDNGIGIPPPMQARIFDLFAQVDNASSRTCGGLGIGLTIVKTLVEMHGGAVSVISDGPGQGSQFTVRLPLTNLVPAPCELPDERLDEPLPDLKILIVDDNQSAAHLMSRLLQKLGQRVHVAECGPDALAQMPQVTPDIVISDVAMPGMTGYDLARRIRELDLPRRPYLVAVTGYGQDSDKQDALAAGFDKHLTKPVGVSTLEQLLRSRGGRP